MGTLAGSDEAVERLGLMDSAPEERFDRITRLAQEIFDVDNAVMNVVDSSTVFTKSQPSGSTFRHTPPDDSFCAEAVKQDDILEITDATHDPRFADRAIVTEHGVRYYAGFPLRTSAGETVATLCLLDSSPQQLTADDRQKFERFGRWAEAEIRNSDPDAGGEPSTVDAPVAEPTRAPVSEHDDLVGGGLRLAALAIPHGQLSGDRSAWAQTDSKVVVTLADVMGKGEVASGFADDLIEALRERRDMAPVDALVSVENQARDVAAYRDTFATLFHAIIDTGNGRVDYVDAGHGLTLLLSADGSTTRLSSRNLPLGLRPRGTDWEAGTCTVGRGDLIVSVSDGALDAYDSTLESLRMIGEDLRHAHEADAFFDQLSVRVSEHVVDDDVTAVVVSIL